MKVCITLNYTSCAHARRWSHNSPIRQRVFDKDPPNFLATVDGMQGRTIKFPLLLPSRCAHKLTTGLALRPPAKALAASVSCKARKPLLQHSCRRVRAASQPDASATSTNSVTSLSDAPLQPVSGELGALPTTAGVYAVYDTEQKLQYIGLSRKVTSRCLRHAQHSGMNRL